MDVLFIIYIIGVVIYAFMCALWIKACLIAGIIGFVIETIKKVRQIVNHT